jgi:hypothetical protein
MKKFHTEDSQTLSATVQNLLTRMTQRPGLYTVFIKIKTILRISSDLRLYIYVTIGDLFLATVYL